MPALDAKRHPLLHGLATASRWVGTDEYPSCVEWADEHESWLQYLNGQGALDRYLPRLKGLKEQRDEAFAEIAVAYFLGVKCGLSIVEWEPPGEGGRVGEFIVADPAGARIFVEVKSPGWEAEIAADEGRASPRLLKPKYIPNPEARATAPWAAIRHAVRKAYPKLSASMPTLLVANDDLMVSLSDWGHQAGDIALYTPKHAGYKQGQGYLGEDGPFANRNFERLGGVGVFTVDLPAEGIRYRFELFENPFALPAVAVPRTFLPQYARHTGAG
jgi:hypothetical protein